MNCPACGCPDLRVLTGGRDRRFRLRQRRCTSCGQTFKTIEALADGVVAYRMRPLDHGRRGSRLAILASRISFVRHLLHQLRDPPASAP